MLRTFLLLFFLSKVQPQNFRDLKFIFVNGNETKNFEYVELNETSKLLNHLDYNNERPTMLYGYGYSEKYTSMSTQTVVESYIERGDHNILVVEWSNYSGGIYLDAVRNSHLVGRIIASTLLRMKIQGFALEKFHLVGHSLGGHLVGYIGRNVKRLSFETTKIIRISALDPAGPLFYGLGSSLNTPLNKDDALFVDVIHTDRDLFGAPDKTGDADFWPNEGRNQPNCPSNSLDLSDEENFCSHRRSWIYYSESVRSIDAKAFNSVRCESWKNFTSNQCDAPDDQVEALMGIDANPSLRGNYFLQTNGNEPFSRGIEGTIYEQP